MWKGLQRGPELCFGNTVLRAICQRQRERHFKGTVRVDQWFGRRRDDSARVSVHHANVSVLRPGLFPRLKTTHAAFLSATWKDERRKKRIQVKFLLYTNPYPSKDLLHKTEEGEG